MATQPQTTVVMIEVATGRYVRVHGCDLSGGAMISLTAIPQPSSQPRHLGGSAVTLATMAAACEPARLPRTQR